MEKSMNDRQANVAQYCDGVLSSKQIAVLAGDKPKYVQDVMLKFDLPRLSARHPAGEKNPNWKGGRIIDRDGYVLVTVAKGHPHARYVKDRDVGKILEHRLLMEKKLGRFLLPTEVVDHIDGLRLHNHVDNLRLFSSNAEHLKATITNCIPKWSAKARQKQFAPTAVRINSKPIDSYRSMKKSGDARLRQILLAALQFGIDSPFLLGSSHHLKKAGISDFSHSNLERELGLLYQRYA